MLALIGYIEQLNRVLHLSNLIYLDQHIRITTKLQMFLRECPQTSHIYYMYIFQTSQCSTWPAHTV